MQPPTENNNERATTLRVHRDRLSAELAAVEDGTLPWMEQRGYFTVENFATAFDLSATAANNRLAKLADLGVLAREARNLLGGGRVFVYCVPPRMAAYPVVGRPQRRDRS